MAACKCEPDQTKEAAGQQKGQQPHLLAHPPASDPTDAVFAGAYRWSIMLTHYSDSFWRPERCIRLLKCCARKENSRFLSPLISLKRRRGFKERKQGASEEEGGWLVIFA